MASVAGVVSAPWLDSDGRLCEMRAGRLPGGALSLRVVSFSIADGGASESAQELATGDEDGLGDGAILSAAVARVALRDCDWPFWCCGLLVRGEERCRMVYYAFADGVAQKHSEEEIEMSWASGGPETTTALLVDGPSTILLSQDRTVLSAPARAEGPAASATVGRTTVEVRASLTGAPSSPETAVDVRADGRSIWSGTVVGIVTAVSAVPSTLAPSGCSFAATTYPTRLPWSGVYAQARGAALATALVIEVSGTEGEGGGWRVTVGSGLRNTLCAGVGAAGQLVAAASAAEAGAARPSLAQLLAGGAEPPAAPLPWRRKGRAGSVFLAEMGGGAPAAGAGAAAAREGDVAAGRLQEVLADRARAVADACAAKERVLLEKLALLEHASKLLLSGRGAADAGGSPPPPPLPPRAFALPADGGGGGLAFPTALREPPLRFS